MKVFIKLTYIILFLFLIFETIINSNIIFNVIHEAIFLWFYKIVPSLVPFFLLSNFLINYGFIDIMSELLKPIMHFFKINDKASFIFVISILTGSPGNAFYIKEALDKQIINLNDATKILMFSHFANPLFILGTVNLLLNDFKISLLILIITYVTNFILAFIFRNLYKVDNKSNIHITNIKKALLVNKSETFGKTLSNSIKKTFDTLLIILGSICFFNIIAVIIKENNIFPISIYPFITGILEMTQGINNVSLLNISFELKVLFITIFLSFGGLSIHSQVISIISDTKIKYLPYLFARLLHALVAGGIMFFLTNYF